MLFTQMKKKIVSSKGKNRLYFFSPMDAFAISSLTKMMIGSINDCNPFGAWSFLLVYDLATEIKIHNNRTHANRISITVLVIEKSTKSSMSELIFPSSSLYPLYIFPFFILSDKNMSNPLEDE